MNLFEWISAVIKAFPDMHPVDKLCVIALPIVTFMLIKRLVQLGTMIYKKVKK